MLSESIRIMTNRIQSLLDGNNPTIYLFGSVTLDDFKLGWSDIDILVLCDKPIVKEQADALVMLRQTLASEFDGNPYFRLFEGGMLSKKAFFNKENDLVVYWGTSGQRIADTFDINSFITAELLDRGVLLCGEDMRNPMMYPSHEQFMADVHHHYNTIRKHALTTNGKITSCGWLLDIARCLYTRRSDKVIAKTAAGEWALSEGLAPNPKILERAVKIRREPLVYANDAETLTWCATLGGHIQAFANVLEREIQDDKNNEPGSHHNDGGNLTDDHDVLLCPARAAQF